MFTRSGKYLFTTKSIGTNQLRKFITKSFEKNKISSSTNHIVTSPHEDIQLPKMLLPQFLWKDIDKWHDKTAIECAIYGKKYTYEELRRAVRRFANALYKSGLRSDVDMVAILLPNMPEFPVAGLGAIEAGLTITPINPTYSTYEIGCHLADCEATCIITHYEQLNKVLTTLKEKNLKEKIRVICVDDFDGHQKSLPDGVFRFSDMINNCDELPENFVLDKTPEDLTTIPYSSGTTGLPKGVCLSHFNQTSNILQTSHHNLNSIEEATANHQDTIPAIIPFFHIFGWELVLLLPIYKGAKIITLPSFIPNKFLDILSSNKHILLNCVPPIIFFLGNSELVKQRHLDQIRNILIGAAPCSAEDFERLTSKKNIGISVGYGLTEMSGAVTLSTKTSTNLNSIGLLLPNVIGKVINWTTGEVLPRGEIGELCFKSPQIMKGYYKHPEATAETIDKDGWLHTGDIGYFDKTGTCFIQDRIKELIKVKGFQVAPAELEAVLRQHPAVNEAGVTSLHLSNNDETPIAFITLKSDIKKPPNEEQIKEFLSSKVAPYKQLSRVIFVKSIPKTASGKILRRKLKELLKNELP